VHVPTRADVRRERRCEASEPSDRTLTGASESIEFETRLPVFGSEAWSRLTGLGYIHCRDRAAL
jgi:hypothetical protein